MDGTATTVEVKGGYLSSIPVKYIHCMVTSAPSHLYLCYNWSALCVVLHAASMCRFRWDAEKFAPDFSIVPLEGYISPGMEVGMPPSLI